MANRVWNIDGKEVVGTEGSAIRWDDHQFFTLTYKGQKFFGELVEEKTEENYLKIKINQRVFEVKKKGELDDLISALGLDVPKVRKLKELQAPMPGRIVQVAVQIGQELNVGDELLSFEAMKMENVIKSPVDGTIKKVGVYKSREVEKNTILIEFA